jgi:hypothetical protein
MADLSDERGQIPSIDPDDDTRRVRTVGFGFAALIIAVVGSYVIFPEIHSRAVGHGEMHIGNLREEFANISPPSGASPLHDATVHARVGKALVSNRYSASGLTPTAVLDEYGRRLLSNGWTSAGRYPTGRSMQESFCKGPYEATLEVHADSAFWYDFSMAWNDVTVRECSDAAD